MQPLIALPTPARLPSPAQRSWLRRSSVRLLLACSCVPFILAGCEEPLLEYTEVKRPDERVSAAEFASFKKIVSQLPDEKLPELPPVFLPPPDWQPNRTLSIAELTSLALTEGKDRWSIPFLSRSFKNSKRLTQLARREKLTVEQFLGLYLTIGIAHASTQSLPPAALKALEKQSLVELDSMRRDDRPMVSLSSEARDDVLTQGIWLARLQRAQILLMVPDENLSLVLKHADFLKTSLPSQFLTDPIEPVANRRDELGMPFDDSDPSRDDATLDWSQLSWKSLPSTQP
jgi:hypothetical protein